MVLLLHVKRPVSRKQIEEIAEDIEKKISNKMLTEIESETIMKWLWRN